MFLETAPCKKGDKKVKTIHWGMIGCGAVTEVKSGPALYKCDNSMLYAVTSDIYEKTLDYAKRHNVGVTYETTEQLLADPKVDIVYIATPPQFHMNLAIQCAKAGKAAYIEKPMANSYKDCQTIIDVFTEQKIQGFTAFYRRAMDKFCKIKKYIDSGEIGSVRAVNVRCESAPEKEEYCKETLPWRLKMELTGGGKFLDAAIHTIDILQFLIGDITFTQSIVENQGGLYDVEDILAVGFKFDNGVIGTGSWCYTSFEEVDEVEIIGTEGKIIFSVYDNVPFTLVKKSGRKIVDVVNYEHVQHAMIQSIVDELNGSGKCASTLYSAAKTAKIMDEILEDYRKRKKYTV